MERKKKTTPPRVKPQGNSGEALLKELPGLIGAVDRFMIDKTGERIPFVIVAFTAGQAVHATNIPPPQVAFDGIKEFAKALE